MKKGYDITRDFLLSLVEQSHKDGKYFIYHFKNGLEGQFHSVFISVEEMKQLLIECPYEGILPTNPNFSFPMYLVNEQMGLEIRNFFNNIDYKTDNVEGFLNYHSPSKPYYNVFIKMDDSNKEEKTITFKLADKEKTLILIEEGFNGFISKPYKRKYLKCVSFEELKKHIEDSSEKDLYNARMSLIGRKVLNIPIWKD